MRPGETAEDAQARQRGRRFTLAEARDERTKARGLVRQGINPSHKRKLDRITRGLETAITFESVAKEWLALKDWEDVTKARRLNMLERAVFPKIGSLSVKSITPAHILDVLNIAPGTLTLHADRQQHALQGGGDAAVRPRHYQVRLAD